MLVVVVIIILIGIEDVIIIMVMVGDEDEEWLSIHGNLLLLALENEKIEEDLRFIDVQKVEKEKKTRQRENFKLFDVIYFPEHKLV